MATIPATQQVYVDESGMNERDEYGYSRRGQRFYALKSGTRRGPVNMTAAYLLWASVDGSLYGRWLVQSSGVRNLVRVCLVPSLTPRQVVILDNALFHKGRSIQALIEAAGCRLLYLPPYSS